MCSWHISTLEWRSFFLYLLPTCLWWSLLQSPSSSPLPSHVVHIWHCPNISVVKWSSDGGWREAKAAWAHFGKLEVVLQWEVHRGTCFGSVWLYFTILLLHPDPHAKSPWSPLAPLALMSQTICSRSFGQTPIFLPELTHLPARIYPSP